MLLFFPDCFYRCIRNTRRIKYCNLSDICGDETSSEMELVCPIVFQDFYFPKLKCCYNKNSCLASSFFS